jgi:hypothetical protein
VIAHTLPFGGRGYAEFLPVPYEYLIRVAYAVQYAKLLSSGATVVAFGRNDEKLAVAKQ